MALFGMIFIFCATTVFPVYWMLVSVFQPIELSLRYPPPLFPQAFDLQVFSELFKVTENPDRVDVWIFNSIRIASLSTIICLVLSVLGAYALSSMRWKGKGLFGILLLMTQMLPQALILIPLYSTVDHLRLKNNPLVVALVDSAFVLPICIWILKNVFDQIPREIREAALVDGCTRISVLWRVMLPIASPGLVAVAVVAFFDAWNEYLFAAALTSDKRLYPASVGLASMITMVNMPVDRLMAAGLVFSIFPVIFYLLVQRYVVSGLSAGAVKG